jgi:hypothetical protein
LLKNLDLIIYLWLGHDPSPWVERQNDFIRVWSDGGLGESVQSAFHLDVSYSAFREGLIMVERELQAFLFSIDSWGQKIGFEQSNALFQKFDRCFDIYRRYTKPFA